MINDKYNILTEMLANLKQELSEVNVQIQCNLLSIKEEEACIKALEDSDSNDFKMFYPRAVKEPHKDEIDKANHQIKYYEAQNQELYEQKAVIENKIQLLEKVIKLEDHNITAFNFQEEDRRRIASDLHDTSLQNLVHLIHKIELCNLYIDEDPLKAKLELSLISKNLKEIVNEIRNTIFDLRPMSFDDLGMKASFERLLERINEDNKYQIISDIDDVSCENHFILLYIYRAVQESLNNIVKHAEAEKINFRCKVVNDVCVIDIEDDGKGFYEESDEKKEDKHFGLSLMRERIELLNGKLDILSSKGDGTKIHMEIPLTE